MALVELILLPTSVTTSYLVLKYFSISRDLNQTVSGCVLPQELLYGRANSRRYLLNHAARAATAKIIFVSIVKLWLQLKTIFRLFEDSGERVRERGREIG